MIDLYSQGCLQECSELLPYNYVTIHSQLPPMSQKTITKGQQTDLTSGVDQTHLQIQYTNST
jgi:hypothetical protein